MAKQDEELLLMAQAVRLLERLDPAARRRVLRYLQDREWPGEEAAPPAEAPRCNVPKIG